ncbi:hypothetical protein [Rubellimicrobium arenae]|uniref:hypothetical protein n=1 Tax=Rubellimicrobium arenae TaxID=2817372 RepID=UPI001B3110E9|nr:hypothetical protein [Rubellimicrobium arenae]
MRRVAPYVVALLGLLAAAVYLWVGAAPAEQPLPQEAIKSRPVETVQATPATSNRAVAEGPSLGTNLSSLNDWSTEFPFIDLFKMSRPWFTQTQGTWDTGEAGLLDLDEHGWVRRLTRDGSPAPFERVSTVWTTAGNYLRKGSYVVDWKGEGSLEIGGGVRVLDQSDHRIVFALEGDTSWISITSTDPKHSGDYIRDIRIYYQDDGPLLDDGLIFNPAFIEKIENFRVLRFMDWMNTNNSELQSWADTTPIGAASQASYEHGGGASVDMMVALANQVGADPWFTIPHQADDDYIRHLATYVRDHLDPGLVARFEYSNEVWNWGFAQASWVQQKAVEAWGEEAEGGWMQWYGMRAAEMARIVADVFGEEAGTRALNVFSTQFGWLGLEAYALDAPAYVAQGGTPPRDAPFHVYAVAPYFGGTIGSEDMIDQVADWTSEAEGGIQEALDYVADGPAPDSIVNLPSSIAHHAEVARSLGWRLEAYEGGQHIVDLAGLFGGEEDLDRTHFLVTLANRPEMGDLYRRYLETWRNAGGTLMAQFSDFGVPSRYGSWGLWESAFAGDNPRSLAVEAFRDGVQPWWDDARPLAVFGGHPPRTDADVGSSPAAPSPVAN